MLELTESGIFDYLPLSLSILQVNKAGALRERDVTVPLYGIWYDIANCTHNWAKFHLPFKFWHSLTFKSLISSLKSSFYYMPLQTKFYVY